MKKYLYMIAALFGIDYFCKENIEAQNRKIFRATWKKAMKDPVPQSQRRFLFGVKRKERTGSHGAGCLYLGGSGHS